MNAIQTEKILRDKILNRAASNGKRIESAIADIQVLNNRMNDMCAYTDQFNFDFSGGRLMADFGDGSASIGKFATKQLGSMFKVPTNFINKSLETQWGSEMITEVLNKHAQNIDPNRMLVRRVDDNIRGILSDSYKRIDSLAVYMAFLTAAQQSGAKIYDAEIDETKQFIEVVRPDIITVETPKNGIVNFVLGAQIRNSDFGDGALSVRTYMMNVVCLNGMIGQKHVNEIHRGEKLPENIALSAETYTKVSEANAAVVGDSIAHIFSDDTINREINRMKDASEQEIDTERELKQLKRTKHYSDFELELLTKKLIANNPDDGVQGKETKWKFVQGLTSVANEYTTTRKQELIEYASALY